MHGLLTCRCSHPGSPCAAACAASLCSSATGLLDSWFLGDWPPPLPPLPPDELLPSSRSMRPEDTRCRACDITQGERSRPHTRSETSPVCYDMQPTMLDWRQFDCD